MGQHGACAEPGGNSVAGTNAQREEWRRTRLEITASISFEYCPAIYGDHGQILRKLHD